MNRYIVISLMVVLLALTSCSMVAEHEWSPWSVIKEATCEETGLKKAICLICDAEKEETIPKHAHTLNAHNKCSECGKYQIAEDYGEGDTLSRKLQIAISDISSEGAIVALHEGTYNFGEIGAQTISEKGVTVEGVRGKNNENTAVFTLPSGTEEAIKATGEDFSLKNVTINVTGSSSAALTLTGNNAVITNTDINLADSSKNTKAIGDITDGQSVTLDGVNINGGGITSSGDLVVKNSTIETSSGRDALDIKGGTVSLTGSTLEGNVKSEKTIESITITDSSINTGNNGGTNTLKGKTVTIDSSNLGGSSDITATGDAIISGSNLSSGGTTKITASTVSLDSTTVGGSVTVEATKKTSVTGSSINEGEESGKLALISPVISIAGTKLAGDISLDAGSSSTANKITIEESSVNDSGSGKLTVTGGTLSVDKSSLSGDITIEKSVSGAKITSSTIDTSAGSNALKTGTDITIEGSTVTKGSGLYVIPTTGTTVKVSISSSTSDTGEEITNQTMRSIVSKELSDDEVNKGDVIYPWTSGGSCSVDDAVVPESLFFTLENNDGTTYTFQADKGVEITLSSYVQSRGSSYVGPTFYSDSDYTKEIKKIKLTGDNKYIITDPSTDTTTVHDGPIATKWEYKVSFNLDGGTGSTATATTTDNGKLTITNPTKDNCTFAGWYDASDSEKKIVSTAVEDSDSTTSVTLTKPISLNAKWSATVTFNTNEGTTANDQTVICGEKITSLPKVTRDNYIFGGWYKDSELKKEFNKDRDVITENITLYAKWRVSVTIGSDSKVYDVGDTIQSSDDEYLKSQKGDVSNREFKGWYTDKNCNAEAEFPITLSGSIVLYPLYECKVTIAKKDDETLSGSTDSLSFKEGTTITTENFFARPDNGYIRKDNRKFAGWYTKDSSGNESEVTSTTQITSNITIYAKWNVSYSIGDSTTEVEVPEGTTIKIDDLTEERKTEKTFIKSVKWYDAASTDTGRTEYGSGTSVEITGVNQKFYPEDEYYKPTLSEADDLNGCSKAISGRSESGSISVDSEGKLTLPTLSSTNYDFAGWYNGDELVGEGGETSYVVSAADENITLTPKWNIRKFTITFNANGGTSSLSSKTVEYGDTMSDLGTPTRSNYNFDGWYEGPNKVSSLSDITKNHTLTAKWVCKVIINGTEYSSENSTEITFKSSTSGTTTTYYAVFGSFVCSQEVPEGKQFDGWTISGTSDKVVPGSRYYETGYPVTNGGSISISGSVSTIKVKVTVQNHKDGIVNTVGTYDVDYGTTVSTLVSTNKNALQEDNMYYAIGTYGNATLGSSWSGYKFTADTTVQQVCYIWIHDKNKDKSVEGWVYCGDCLTVKNFQYKDYENKAFEITEDVIKDLKYNLQQTETYEKKFDPAIALTQNVNLIRKSGT